MDSYMSRQRYTRRRTASYRRPGITAGIAGRPGINMKRGRLRRIIVLQTIICITLFFVVFAAKMINIPAGRFITDNARYILEHNVGLKNIYTYAQSLVTNIRESIALGNEDKRQKDQANEKNGKLADETGKSESVTDPASAGEDKEITAALSGVTGAPGTVNASSGIDIGYDTDSAEDEGYGQTGVLSASSSGHESADASGTGGNPVYVMTEPVEGRLATPFGETEAAAGMWKMHNGIDIAVEGKSDVKAVLDGQVTEAGSAPGYGRFIKVRHEDGLVTVYANCSNINADIDDIVKKGDVIAGIGGERVSGGCHLHFEVWHNNVPVDPLDYVSIGFR